MHTHRLALLLSLSLATVTVAQEIWVEPLLGNDGNPGSYTLPLQTLTQALNVAGPGARINLLPGLYGPANNGETLPLSIGLLPQQNMVIRGLGTVVFDLNGSASTVLRLVNGADGLRLTNITITNSDQTGWWTRVVNSGSGVNTNDAARNVEIDRCTFANINRGFVLWTNDNVQGWRIHSNLFLNCANDAILEYSGTNEFYNNTFATGLWKAYISDSATSKCFNNLIVGYNIAFENNNAANNVARYQANWIWQTTTIAGGPGFVGGLPATNVVNQDPQLVNPAGGDYHPATGSPLIDRGDPGIFARADRDNIARIVDSDVNGSLLPDIGAYETTPLLHGVTWDNVNRLLFVNAASSAPGAFGFVLFCFDDGLFQVPGQGPILLDQATFIPAWLTAVLPGNWVLNLNGSPPFFPGQRLVTFTLAIVPSSGVLIGGNQVWTQL